MEGVDARVVGSSPAREGGGCADKKQSLGGLQGRIAAPDPTFLLPAVREGLRSFFQRFGAFSCRGRTVEGLMSSCRKAERRWRERVCQLHGGSWRMAAPGLFVPPCPLNSTFQVCSSRTDIPPAKEAEREIRKTLGIIPLVLYVYVKGGELRCRGVHYGKNRANPSPLASKPKGGQFPQRKARATFASSFQVFGAWGPLRKARGGRDRWADRSLGCRIPPRLAILFEPKKKAEHPIL